MKFLCVVLGPVIGLLIGWSLAPILVEHLFDKDRKSVAGLFALVGLFVSMLLGWRFGMLGENPAKNEEAEKPEG